MESTSEDEPIDESVFGDDNVVESTTTTTKGTGSGSRGPEDGAPRYSIPTRNLAAVELPAIVENIDRAVKGFGRVPTLKHTLDPSRNSVPYYLNPESPFCPPIMSHSARSHNVVLKVTVPKRTGRKRKRGTEGPWQGDIDIPDVDASSLQPDQVCSIARLDDPKILQRKLEDNVDKYSVEAVGVIKHTHRFRGLADFYWDMSRSSFANKYVSQVLPGDVSKLKDFKFEPGTDKGPNVDIIPPPIFTHMSLPFNYFYSQNPYVRATEDGGTINTTAVKHIGYFIGADDPAPAGPQEHADMTDARVVEVIADLESAFEDRPVWTRRSLLNHLGGRLRNWNELKKYLNYTAYQFKGGPWRDGVVPYGIDPRTDPKYRIYQTLMFKLPKQKHAHKDQTWQSLRKNQQGPGKEFLQETSQSHVFDGETYHTDGKVWQVCDITDPLLKDLLDNAEVRETWDSSSGWYHGGLWSKVKAIMKIKLVAIRFGRHLSRRDFEATLNCRDETPTKEAGSTFHIPLPNLRLTDEELTQMRGREPPKKRSQGYSSRVSAVGKAESQTTGRSPAAESQGANFGIQEDMGGPGNEDSGSGSDDDDLSVHEEYPEPPTYGQHGELDVGVAHEDEDIYDDDEIEDLTDLNAVVYPSP